MLHACFLEDIWDKAKLLNQHIRAEYLQATKVENVDPI